MDSALDFHTARALLEWQVELGADEAIGDSPVDRYALEPRAPKPATPAAAPSMFAVFSQRPPVSVCNDEQKYLEKRGMGSCH